MYKLLNYSVYLVFRLFMALGMVLPMGPTFAFLRVMAHAAWHFLGPLRKLALRNLEIAFGKEKSPAERKRIAREALVNLFYSAGEFLFMSRLAKNWKEHFTFEGDDVIEDNIIHKRPFFCFGGHLGGWTNLMMMTERFKRHSIRGAAVMRPQRNPYIDRYLRELPLKYKNGSMFISPRGTGKVIEKFIMEGGVVGFYMDQESRRKQGIQVDFFGLPAYSHVVPGYLAWKHRLPMYPSWFIRKKPGHNHLVFRKPLEFVYTGDKEADIREVTQRIVKECEDTIRQYPEQWLWFHNRWKRTLGEDQPKKDRKKKIKSGQYLTSSQLLKMMDEEIGGSALSSPQGEKKDE